MKVSVAIVTDSSAGISDDERKKFNNLFVLPLMLNLPNEKTVAVNAISDDDFFTMFQQHKTIKTAQTPHLLITGLWEKLLKKFTHIVHLGIGSHYSGQNQMLSQMLKQQSVMQKNIIVINSKLLTTPLRLLIFEACQYFTTNGYDLSGFLKLQTKLINQLQFYCLLTDIAYLQGSGRIPPLITTFLKKTKLIPIVKIKEKGLVLYKKKRTIKKATQFVLSTIRKQSDQIIVAYCQQMPALYLPIVRDLIVKSQFKHVTWLAIDRITLCHTGVNTVQFIGL